MILDLKGIKDKVNKIYHPIFKKESNQFKYIVLYGGAGSGKSYSIAEKILIRIATERNHVILVVRQSYNSHRNTTYEELKKVIASFGLSGYAEYVGTPLEIRFPIFNSKVIFLGVDDPEKLKGLSAVSSIWIDEITSLEPQDFSELEDRLRHPTHVNQFYITFNPVSEHHWIKGRFFDNEDPRALIIKSTYKDNKYCTADYIQQRQMQAITDPSKYRIMTLGEWGVLDRDNLYYHRFDDTKHVAKSEFGLNPDLGIMVSLDFNLTPFISGLVIQVDDDTNTVYIQQELALKSPKNNAEDLGKEVVKYIGDYDDTVTVFGDASGRNGDSGYAHGENKYTIFNSVLQNAGIEVNLSLDSANPRLATRQIFINNILAGVTDIQIVISPQCINLIADLLNQKMIMVNGKIGISKQSVRDKVTGASYEKYGHMGDAFCYMLIRYYATHYNKLKYGNAISTFTAKPYDLSEHLY